MSCFLRAGCKIRIFQQADIFELAGTPASPLPPYAVLVYTDAPDLKLPATPAEIRARINAEPPPPYKLPPQVK